MSEQDERICEICRSDRGNGTAAICREHYGVVVQRHAELENESEAAEAEIARLRAAIDEHNAAWKVLSKDNHNDDLWDRYDASRNALLALTEPRREEERE